MSQLNQRRRDRVGSSLRYMINRTARGTRGMSVQSAREAISDEDYHAPVTVTDTSTINMTLAGQDVKGDVIPGGIKLDDLGAPDDNTDLNASTSKHGLMPKLGNVATQFFNGQGGQSVPDHGSLGGLSDDDHAQYLRTNGSRNCTGSQTFEDDIRFGENHLISSWGSYAQAGYIYTPLSTPITMHNDSVSDSSGTQIDVSSVWPTLPLCKALVLRVRASDSGTPFIGGLYFGVGPSATYPYQVTCAPIGGSYDVYDGGVCNCDANGDIWYQANASGSGTLDVYITIFGFFR